MAFNLTKINASLICGITDDGFSVLVHSNPDLIQLNST
jgi:hypothetical protein